MIVFIYKGTSAALNKPLVTSSVFSLAINPGASIQPARRRALCHHRCQSEGGGAGFGPHSGPWRPPEHLTVLH